MKAYQMTDFRYGRDIPVFRRTLGRFALLLWGLLFCAGAYAQNGRITLHVRNVTLEEATTPASNGRVNTVFSTTRP